VAVTSSLAGSSWPSTRVGSSSSSRTSASSSVKVETAWIRLALVYAAPVAGARMIGAAAVGLSRSMSATNQSYGPVAWNSGARLSPTVSSVSPDVARLRFKAYDHNSAAVFGCPAAVLTW